jgi:ankyrin repeat protein
MESGDWKALIQAIIDQDIEKVNFYLKMDFDPNFLHPEMMTNPIIESARIGHLGITKQLLEKGASPKLTSQLGESAIQIARNNKNKELLRLLKQY